MPVTDKFKEFLFTHCHFKAGEPVIAAVSGGADSVVLADLLYKNKIDFAIAHVNYRLRAEESDGDEIFVAELAKKMNVPFYLHRCEEDELPERENSIQLAARKIRYDFFEKCRQQHGYAKIATAHHKDDSIETALLNFARGTGIKGLTGISPAKNFLIRPLLFATRENILHYLTENKLQWREDSSNATDKYTRNKFRHHLLPFLMAEIPQAYEGFEASFANLDKSEKLIGAAMFLWEKTCCEIIDQDEISISMEKIKSFGEPELFLEFFLRKKGFTGFSAHAIFDLLHGNAGKELISREWKIIRDRAGLFLVKENGKEKNASSYFSFTNEKAPVEIPAEKWSAIVDADLVTLPLEARTWREGDKLVPFGMKGHKNVSDILNEMKLPAHKKEKAVVIISNNEIVWIPGYRIADKFRVTEKTSAVLRLKFDPEIYG
jgi:tRNA(Ile)-lysidine synthase